MQRNREQQQKEEEEKEQQRALSEAHWVVDFDAIAPEKYILIKFLKYWINFR